MPELVLNDEGILVDAEGTPFEVDGEAVKVGNALTNKAVDQKIQERLARQTDRVKQLEAQANKTPELEKLLEEMKSERAALEDQAKQAQQAAREESHAQMTNLEKERDKYKQQAEQEKQARVQFEVQTAILGAAKDQFNDPATDLVPHLQALHKREPVKGEDGKETGAFTDLFKMTVKNEKGDESEEWMPVGKAIETWAAQHPHHVRANGAGGSGGGQYDPSHKPPKGQLDYSQMDT